MSKISGNISELRPYGPKGKKICYCCGMKNIEETNRQIMKVITGTTCMINNETGEVFPPKDNTNLN